MPIPTRSKSVRSTAPPAQSASKPSTTTQQGTKEDEQTHRRLAVSRTNTTLPLPRTGGASGLPRKAGNHMRTQSASLVNDVESNPYNRATPASQQVQPKTSDEHEHGRNSQVRVLSTSGRSEHRRSESTVVGTRKVPHGYKPAFNTYQQQFSLLSPRSNTLSSSKELGRNRPSFETVAASSQQEELLQLMLVHARSQETLKQYASSAASELEARASRLRRDEAELIVLEEKKQEHVNIFGLIDWSGRWDRQVAAGHLRTLSLVVRELSDLLNEDGLFIRTIGQFERWEINARKSLEEGVQTVEGGSVGFLPVAGLPAAWQPTAEALKTRLSLCKQSLCAFGQLDDGSAFGKVISDHCQLASAMLEELDTCMRLRGSFTIFQENHISRALARIISETRPSQQKAETLQRTPLWESLRGD